MRFLANHSKKMCNKFFILLALVVLTGCSTARKIEKAKKILDDNEQAAIDYCKVKTPAVNTVTVKVDTAGYNATVNRLKNYSDSVLNEAGKKNDAIIELGIALGDLQEGATVDAATIQALKAKLAQLKPVDIKGLRASIEAEIRSSIKPCEDSLIVTENGPIIADLRKQVRDRDAVIEKLSKQNEKLSRKTANKNKWLLIFGGALFVMIAWDTKGLWFPGLKGLNLLKIFKR